MEQYRDFSEFCEQLNDIKQKFHKWDSCEKTVALYYLMVGLPFANARFLQHALEQGIVAVNSTETQILEQNANDSNVILNFLLEQPDVVLSLLLSHLPLLKPGNKGAAKCYLRVIRQILLEFVTPPYKIYNECVEVISYVYIHPAFSNEDKKSFKNLLKQVLIKVSPDNFIHSFGTESSDESLSPSSDVTENSHKNSRSNSLTPSQDIASPKPPSKPRSYSLCTDKLLNTVITTTQQNRSEIRLQDLVLRNNTPAMKSIIAWLKSLRLHKYSWVFNNLTYTHMINLTDETLQAIGITKGARHKLLISIIKLKERSTLLSELERGIMKGGDINNALKKLKNILQTPLEISMDNENLPSQFVKVMGKGKIIQVCDNSIKVPDVYFKFTIISLENLII